MVRAWLAPGPRGRPHAAITTVSCMFGTRANIARLAAASVLVFAGACSDDGEAIDPDADEDVIEDALLTADDLPEGFEEFEIEDDDDAPGALEECGEEVGIDADEVDDNRVVEAEEVEFRLDTDEEVFVSVRGSVGSVRDPDLSARTLEAFDDDDFQDCVFDELEDRFEGDSEGFDAEVVEAAADGDASAAVRIEVEQDGFPVELEQHFVLVGRFGVTVQVVSVNEPVADDLVEDALDVMIERIEDATT